MDRRAFFITLGIASSSRPATLNYKLAQQAHQPDGQLPTESAVVPNCGGSSLFIDMAAHSHAQDTMIINSAGFNRSGVGSATYLRSGDQSSACSRSRFKTLTGVYFELSEHAGFVTPEQFGAHTTDAVPARSDTENEEALSSWIQFCASKRIVAYLNGHYLATKERLLNVKTGTPGVIRLKLLGMGSTLSSLTFRPSQGDKSAYYLYDGKEEGKNQTVSFPLQSLHIEGVSLRIDASHLQSGIAHWFRQSGWTIDPNPEQNWFFSDVRFVGDERFSDRSGNVLSIIGDANCSENVFTSCFGRHFHSVILCENAQAVNHTLLSSNWELSSGSLFNFVRGGGLTVVGGSLIVGVFDRKEAQSRALGLEDKTKKASKFVLEVGGDGSGQINSFSIRDSRCELRSSDSGIVQVVGPNTRGSINFDACDIQAVSGKQRTTIILVGSETLLTFRACTLCPPGGFTQPIVISIDSTKKSGVGSPLLLFTECILSHDIRSLVIFGESFGAVRFRDNLRKSDNPAADRDSRIMTDMTLVASTSASSAQLERDVHYNYGGLSLP